jgi:hypothetical protein
MVNNCSMLADNDLILPMTRGHLAIYNSITRIASHCIILERAAR